MLLKGTYADEDQEAFKGCSVGCHLHHIHPEMTADEIYSISEKHAVVAGYYEYPEWLALLQDTIFEGLPTGDSSRWHVQMAEAIAARNGNINWRETLHRVHIAILRVSCHTAGNAKAAVQSVIDLHERAISGIVSEDEWSAAESAAWSAARSAVRCAA